MGPYCEIEWLGNRWVVNFDSCPAGEKCPVENEPPGWFIGQIKILFCEPA